MIRMTTLGARFASVAVWVLSTTVAIGCAETQEQRVHVIKHNDAPPPVGGIPPDKQAEVQQRNPSTLKCYEDVLNEKHDRAFKGTVIVLLALEPAGRASEVTVTGGTLNNKEVSDCLIEKLKDFEYPQIPSKGSMQYVYQFQPAY
jgi:hypothetical protein